MKKKLKFLYQKLGVYHKNVHSEKKNLNRHATSAYFTHSCYKIL